MPRRSNDFQRLVLLVQEALATLDGATVTESALIREPDGTPREVDILLERKIADLQLRIAIECRDRGRKSDVEWIDGLIGKYRNLSVDKVIAVSRTGFTSTAKSKAQAAKIELRTLQECLSHEWPSEFGRLGFVALRFVPTMRSFTATFEPDPLGSIDLDDQVESSAIGRPLTLREAVLACYHEAAIPCIKAHFDSQFLARRPTRDDLQRSWIFEVVVQVRDVHVQSRATRTRFNLLRLSFDVPAQSTATESEVTHFRYGSAAMVTVGKLDFGVDMQELRVTQLPGSKNLKARLSERKPK
jgi:hypothetical protein